MHGQRNIKFVRALSFYRPPEFDIFDPTFWNNMCTKYMPCNQIY